MDTIKIRSFQENDFQTVQELNENEGWNSLVARGDEAICAWLNSEPSLIASDGDEIIGFLRGLTDGTITLYVCEMLVKESYRNRGIGEQLIRVAHECYPSTRIEMLASSTSHSYYERNGYRSFYGFRKAAEELN